ncbi:hypothetical protein VTK73DRAFT_8469 [Phialemonium thermophilum]|uniref:Glucose-6-phosphate 1-epimerase n=1 Tax=Phialemonium thermophilum TaxID=223376 RepID=A0ABR3W8I6_9PEZI
MVERRNKPSALASTPGLVPQPQVNISHGNQRVSAVLPTGESVEVMLYGATVVSWKDSDGNEKLWLSEATKLDGSKPIRGGIPLVFPVFGPPPANHPTSKLPQHGLARTSRWEFLGKSTSESEAAEADLSVKLDFGLSAATLDEAARALWPYTFGLIYSVTLTRDSLTTSLVVTNDDNKPFDVQVLLHTYFRIPDINKIQITGLEGAEYIDKVDNRKIKTQETPAVTITSETDRVYTPKGGADAPIAIVDQSSGRPLYKLSRDNLGDVVVWNPWAEKAVSMPDFGPDDGYRNMVCVEAGAVRGWQTLEPGDAFEGAQTITLA